MFETNTTTFSSDFDMDYVLSDFLSVEEAKIGAEVPVPDRLRSKRTYSELVNSLKLSQKIGLLIWLNRNELLTIGGKERLVYLQAKASFEAIEAGIRFARRLTTEKKLQSDFNHHMRELNRRPQSKRFRKYEKRRIGVGYRDKGTLPDPSFAAVRKAQEESFVYTQDLPEEIVVLLKTVLPSCLTEDEEWVDLSEVTQGLRSSEPFEMFRSLLTPL